MKLPALSFALGFLIFTALAQPASASTTLSIEGPSSVRPGSDATYALRASLTEPVNALAFTVVYDSSVVETAAFAAGDSVIRSWLERSIASDSIRLEGIIPGGAIAESDGTVPLGYVTLHFSRAGRTVLSARDVEVYLNRATPTRDAVRVTPLTITVTAAAPESDGAGAPATPEGVTVSVFRTPGLFDGAWSLAYDIRIGEGPVSSAFLRERFLGLFGGWREISSPASLSDQSRLSILEVGIPADGGVRILYREVPKRLLILAMLLALVAIGYALKRRMKH